jgi:hypothetical protein
MTSGGRALGVPATRIHEIVKERRGITADTAERLARYFGGDSFTDPDARRWCQRWSWEPIDLFYAWRGIEMT